MTTTVCASWPWEWGPAQWLAAAPVSAVLVAAAGPVIAKQQTWAYTLKDLQHRPYVIVDLEFRCWLVMLTVRNICVTPASNCTLEFDQPLEVPHRKLGRNDHGVSGPHRAKGGHPCPARNKGPGGPLPAR